MPQLTATRILMKCVVYVLLILMAKPLAAQTSVMPIPLPSAQDIVNRSDLFEQFGRERLMTYRSRLNLAGIDEFKLGHVRILSQSVLIVSA